MATSGEVLTYAQLERRSNKLAHLLRANGLRRLNHYAVFYGEQYALRRMLRRRRAGWLALHLRQFISDAWLTFSITAKRECSSPRR